MSRSNKRQLAVDNHSRDSTGMRYVYAVLSRRARGVSVGINLNPNNACNWACNYCQVPNLVRGKGPTIELPVLEHELSQLLHDVQAGRFMTERVAEGSRSLKDIAFSGNGEPTTSPNFEAAVESVAAVLQEQKLLGKLPMTLITNGSMLNKESILRSLDRLAAMQGRVWFKFDRATAKGCEDTNGQAIDVQRHLERLHVCAERCETWIQTCMFSVAEQVPSAEQCEAYLGAISQLVESRSKVAGVLLYSLARESQQPQADRLTALGSDWLGAFAERIRQTGMPVQVHA